MSDIDNLRDKIDEITLEMINLLKKRTEIVKQIGTTKKQTHLSIFLKAKSLEQQGKKIIHMEVGEPDFLPPKIVKDALEEVFDKGFVKYGQVKGMPEFRSALAKKTSEQYGIDSKQENIIVCPGARYSRYLAITPLLNPR